MIPPMTPERIVTEGREFADRAAEWIAAVLREIVARQGRCTLALAGGTTPGPVYRHLAGLSGLPWAQVEVYFGDERGVPPDHPDSNYRLALETLLSRVAIPPTQVHRMEAERADRDRAARDYEALLPDPLDLLLLGVGRDGHVVSLFPRAPALAERIRQVLPVMGGSPELPRLTVTVPVIQRARNLLTLARGAAKAAVVAAALDGPLDIAGVPAQLGREGAWVLDRAAAADLARVAR
jgi:6-phosphogluconolactonase